MFGKNPLRPPETGDGSTLNVVEIFPTLQGEGPFVGQPAVFVRLGGCNLACGFCDTEFEKFEARGLDDIITRIIHLAADSDAGAPLPRGEVEKCQAPQVPFAISPERHFSGEGEYAYDLSHPHPDLQPNAKGVWANPASPQGRGVPVAPHQAHYLRDLVVITGGEPLRQNIVPLCEALLAKGLRVQIETNGTLWRPLPEGVSIVCSPKMSGGQYHPLRPDLLARVDVLKFIVKAGEGDYHAIGDVGHGERAIPVYVQPMDEYDPEKNRANAAYALELAQANGFRLSVQMHKIWGIQ